MFVSKFNTENSKFFFLFIFPIFLILDKSAFIRRRHFCFILFLNIFHVIWLHNFLLFFWWSPAACIQQRLIRRFKATTAVKPFLSEWCFTHIKIFVHIQSICLVFNNLAYLNKAKFCCYWLDLLQKKNHQNFLKKNKQIFFTFTLWQNETNQHELVCRWPIL